MSNQVSSEQATSKKYRFEKSATFGDTLGPAMKITEQADADAYFEALVDLSMQYGKSRVEAEAIVRDNLGYWTGYYDDETAERVFKLFKCAHPVFGTTKPTPEEAFRKGQEMGQKLAGGAQ